eukprot:scaffold38177_cov46-Cyclotella_meneghiniana.AAC.1
MAMPCNRLGVSFRMGGGVHGTPSRSTMAEMDIGDGIEETITWEAVFMRYRRGIDDGMAEIRD